MMFWPWITYKSLIKRFKPESESLSDPVWSKTFILLSSLHKPREILPQHVQLRIFRRTALRLPCLRPAVQLQQLLRVNGQSGSCCTTCLDLWAALQKVKIQLETQISMLQSQTSVIYYYTNSITSCRNSQVKCLIRPFINISFGIVDENVICGYWRLTGVTCL